MRTDRIAHLYTHAGPFASVFVDVSRDSEAGAHEVDLQAREVHRRLAEQGAPETALALVDERVAARSHHPAPVSRAVVTTENEVLLDETAHVHTEHATAVWGALPDLDALISYEDETVAFVLALVDHEGGDVATYRSNAIDPDHLVSAGGQTEHEHKVRGGGLAHLRYQRTAENTWAHNAGDVADEIHHRVSAGVGLVILAGEPGSRSEVAERLPDGAEVVQLDHGARARDGGDEALDEAVREVLAEHAVARRLEATQSLEDRLGRGEGAVTGVADIADAFVRGQVETLLFDPGAAAELRLVPGEHPGFPLATDPDDSPVRADLAFVAAAAQTGAAVVVGPTAELAGTPVAALLRWYQ